MNRERSAMIDNYLFGKISNSELESFEQQLMTDDALIFEVAQRENELVDMYVGGKLDSSASEQFRASLSRFPARVKKLQNASLLREYIFEARPSAESAAREPWYRRLGFAFRAPAFAATALGVVLVAMVGLLFVQNRNLNNQIAQLDANATSLSELRQREAELQAMLAAERAAGSDLTTDLDSERERRSALEAELADLRRQIASKPATNEKPIVPTIATLILRPSGTRGGPPSVPNLRLDNNEQRVALKIILPGDISEEVFSVRVNDVSVSNGLKPRKEPGGANSITVSVGSNTFRNGMNRVEVFDSRPQNVLSFAVVCERGPVR